MRSGSLLMLAVLSAMVCPGLAGAALIGPFDFESDGQMPQYANIWSTGITSTLVDNTTTPLDPFGPDGNHSYMLEDNSTVDQGIAIWNNTTDPALAKGTFSARIVTQAINEAWDEVYLGTNSSSSMGSADRAVQLSLGNGYMALNGTALTNSWSPNTAHTVTLTFDVANNTVSGTLDGDPLKQGANESFALLGSYAATHADINAVMLIAAYGSATSRIFVDDLSLSAVPEPATLSLLGLGGAALLLRRRR